MAFTPSTRVCLLNTPLDNSYNNQIKFNTVYDQQAYFTTRIKHEFFGCTYQRKDNTLRVREHIDNLWNVNYVMYQNSNFNDKWFYGFITEMRYISDNTTEIVIETDVYQTWLFDFTVKDSFVIREHVAVDTIGKHLIEEQLETGEYIMETVELTEQLGPYWNVLAVSDNTPFGNSELIGNIYGSVVTGLTYYPFPNTSSGVEWLQDVIQTYTSAGKIDAIVMIFTAPQFLLPTVQSGFSLGDPIQTNEPYSMKNFTKTKALNGLNGYIPKNNKLYTYPYKFLYVSNNVGESATFRYEDFPTNEMRFQLFGAIMPDPTIVMCPWDYKGGSGIKPEYSLKLSGYPLGSWNSDAFNAWFAQNSAGIGISLGASTAMAYGGIVTANPLGVASGVMGITNELTQLYQHSKQPDQTKGSIGKGSVMYSNYLLDFAFSHMSIKYEFAKRIDDYFTMFGYKVNSLKVPEMNSRSNWNYVKTIDVNITGDLPFNDMNRLKRAFNDGITLWHTFNHFLDYSQSNSIV